MSTGIRWVLFVLALDTSQFSAPSNQKASSAYTADSWELISAGVYSGGGGWKKSCSSSGYFKVLNDVRWVWADTRTGPGPVSLCSLTQIETDRRESTQDPNYRWTRGVRQVKHSPFGRFCVCFCTEAAKVHIRMWLLNMWTEFDARKQRVHPEVISWSTSPSSDDKLNTHTGNSAQCKVKHLEINWGSESARLQDHSESF